MWSRIIEQLAGIEVQHGVKILYACESGSRAWGFASTDSDWDIRFLYVHPQNWYLAVDLERKRDVIEMPITDNLDFSGWDLRKALQLFYKSNPPLIEWLHSPIVYRDENGLADRLRQLLGRFYSPRSCYYHYLHMAKGNYREYLRGDRVWLKKYLYVLRPLLALEWMNQSPQPVPVRFDKLLNAVLPRGSVRRAIDQLLRAKTQGMEGKYGPTIPIINRFIETELDRLKRLTEQQEKRENDIEELNKVFRGMVENVGKDTLKKCAKENPP